jgi:serine phosphatase RsbU (regulator of sigma subunit)
MPSSKRHRFLIRFIIFIRETWRYFSGLGTNYRDISTEMRSCVLNNQINFILGISMAVLGLVLLVRMKILNISFGIGILRVWCTFILCILNLVLAHFKFNRLSKYSLIFLPPLVFMIIPTMAGFVEEEGYTYNAYILIAASIVPQMILSSEKDKLLYWVSMLYYFLLVSGIDFLAFSEKSDSQIYLHIQEFNFIFKLAHIGVFIFINLNIYHLRKVNFRFEDRLNEKNHILDFQNRELKSRGEKILKQKNIIEEKSRDIFESIQYASRIQEAVLQPIDFLNEWGVDNFILYKPANVVSGDFYWGCKKDERIVIAAGDCTGHGVPGALMSILGISFLDDIFDTRKILNAADVLNYLREDVIRKLRQKGTSGEAKDGMDISLCIIDNKTGILNFAGANNPAYMIRDGSFSIIKADKIPIGIDFRGQIPFTNNDIEVRRGDHIYLFSDGYADQFGGPSGKKFMYKPFQDLLVRIHDSPMIHQKEILENTFEEWKGIRAQIDDVMVIGLRI